MPIDWLSSTHDVRWLQIGIVNESLKNCIEIMIHLLWWWISDVDESTAADTPAMLKWIRRNDHAVSLHRLLPYQPFFSVSVDKVEFTNNVNTI